MDFTTEIKHESNWYWVVVAANGETIARSASTYPTEVGAVTDREVAFAYARHNQLRAAVVTAANGQTYAKVTVEPEGAAVCTSETYRNALYADRVAKALLETLAAAKSK